MLLWKLFQPSPSVRVNNPVPEIHAAGMLLTSVLFGVVGFYLTLIAKFYRQKFQKGPPYRYLQASLAVLMTGLLLNMKFFAFLPASLPSALVCLGGLAFTGLSYALYRTMMSVS
jgi:hypothetical protein